jgi:hypothetical protein
VQTVVSPPPAVDPKVASPRQTYVAEVLVFPFSIGRGRVTVSGVIGSGDPLRAACSRYAGYDDPSPGGGVTLTTRNCRRCGVCVLCRRSRSPLPVRGGEIGNLGPGLLGEQCSTSLV